MTNVQERLRVLFGSRFAMKIDSSPGQGTRTHIDFPELEVDSANALRKASA
jgi:sensor histidine kinase YesM